MKASTFLALSFLHYCGSKNHERKSILPQAISSILVDYFANNSRTVDIIIHRNNSQNNERLVDMIPRLSNGRAVIQVSRTGVRKLQLNTSSILLFDSPQSFREIYRGITWQSDKKRRHRHLVQISNLSSSELKNIHFEDGFSIDCVNFLVNDNEKSIEMYSSFMFTTCACLINQFERINVFQKSTMRWDHTDLYPEKYRDLHGCSLKVAFWNDSVQSVENILYTLARNQNFEIERADPDEWKPKDRRFDLVCTTSSYANENYTRLITSVYFVFDRGDFAIPPGEPYDQLDKMFIMFDFEVWIAIIVTFSIALLTIQLLNFMPQSIKNLVYGRNVTSPTLNLVSTFLIGAQDQIPQRSFARFILMLFIIWSLIIRTCHQSMLFTYLQSDIRKPMMTSLQDLVDNNFTFYGFKPLELYDDFDDIGVK